MSEILQFFNIDLLNAFSVYFLTSSFVFIFNYLEKYGDFKASIKSTLIYLLISPILIPLIGILFTLTLNLLESQGISKHTVSDFLLLHLWNLETISSVYLKFFLILLVLLVFFVPFRIYRGDSWKDVSCLIFFMTLVIMPAVIVLLYFFLVIFNSLGLNIASSFGTMYYETPFFVVAIIVPVVAIIVFYLLNVLRQRKDRL